MAACDITAKDTIVKGVNSLTNYVRNVAHIINGEENPGILQADTHSLFTLPAGAMLVGLKVVALEDTTSSGSATVQFKAKIGATAEAINGTAIGKADLATGDVVDIPVSKIKAYDEEEDITIQLTVGTAALTQLNLLVIAEYIPVIEFMTEG